MVINNPAQKGGILTAPFSAGFRRFLTPVF
jgi:hypothetical protein